MTKGKPWSEEEQRTCVRVYFNMLGQELAGEKYNKAAYKRAALPLLDGRSAGSWEMKCCNVSAALASIGGIWIKGYKPLPGFQKSLVDLCRAEMRSRMQGLS